MDQPYEAQLVFEDIYKKVCALYPFIDMHEKVEIEKKYHYFYKQLSDKGTDVEFYTTLYAFIKSSKDAHTQIVKSPLTDLYAPEDYSVSLQENMYFLKKEGSDHKLRIMQIEGKIPEYIHREKLKYTSFSTMHYGRYKALQNLLRSWKKDPIHLIIHENGIQKELILERTLYRSKLKRPVVTLHNSCVLITIPSWTDTNCTEQDIQTIVDQMNTPYDTLLFDVRHNQGGNSRNAKILLQHLFKKNITANIILKKDEEIPGLHKVRDIIIPQHPYCTKKVIVITNRACLSSNEYFIATLRDTKRATIIGETTGGSSGNPKMVSVHYKGQPIEILVSTWRYIRMNGTPLERKGIRPHYFVKNIDSYTQDDIIRLVHNTL